MYDRAKHSGSLTPLSTVFGYILMVSYISEQMQTTRRNQPIRHLIRSGINSQ